MDSRLYIHRAENEIKLAGIIFVISEEPNMQKETFKVNELYSAAGKCKRFTRETTAGIMALNSIIDIGST